MEKAKKKMATPKNPRSRTVYVPWDNPNINDDMLCDILNNFYDNINGAKAEAEDAGGEYYIYQVTVTRIAKGTQPPFSWTKE